LKQARERIQHSRQISEVMIPLPLSARISAIQRFLPIESRIAFGHDAVVNIEDVSIAIGIDHVVNMLFEMFHGSEELGQISSLEHLDRLAREERLAEFGDVHCDLFMAVDCISNRSVVGLAKSNFAFGEAVAGFYFDRVLS